MTWAECVNLIKQDKKRLVGGGNFSLIRCLYSFPSFKVTFWYRIGSFLQTKKNKSILLKLIYKIVSIIHKHHSSRYGVGLPFGTRIGGSFIMFHVSCIFINQNAVIGTHCALMQGVTVGGARGKGAPIIGDNVVLSAGCKIIGNVKIGNNVFVGANAVVVKDVPDGATVAGIPAKIINMKGTDNVTMYL